MLLKIPPKAAMPGSILAVLVVLYGLQADKSFAASSKLNVWELTCKTDEMTDEKICIILFATKLENELFFISCAKRVIDSTAGDCTIVISAGDDGINSNMEKSGFRVDKNKPIYTTMCFSSGCMFILYKNQLIQEFRQGETAFVRVNAAETYEGRISLSGFDIALQNMRKLSGR